MIPHATHTQRCLFFDFLSSSDNPAQDVNQLTLEEFKTVETRARNSGRSLEGLAPGSDNLMTRYHLINIVKTIQPFFNDFFTSEEKGEISRENRLYSNCCPTEKAPHAALKKTIEIAEQKLKTDPMAFTFLLDACSQNLFNRSCNLFNRSTNNITLFNWILSIPDCYTKHLDPLTLLEPLSTTFQATETISRICERHSIHELPQNILSQLIINAVKTRDLELVLYLIQNFTEQPVQVLDLIPDEFKFLFLKTISSDKTLFDLLSTSFNKDLLSPESAVDGLCHALQTNNMRACQWFAECNALKDADQSSLKTAFIRSARLKDDKIFFLLLPFLTDFDEKIIKKIAQSTMFMSSRMADWVIQNDGFHHIYLKDKEYSSCLLWACRGPNPVVAIKLMNTRPLEDEEILGQCLLSSTYGKSAELISYILALPKAINIPHCLLDDAFYRAAITSFEKSNPKVFFTQGIELFIDFWIRSGNEALIAHDHIRELKTLAEQQGDHQVLDILEKLNVFLETFKTES